MTFLVGLCTSVLIKYRGGYDFFRVWIVVTFMQLIEMIIHMTQEFCQHHTWFAILLHLCLEVIEF